MEKKLSSSKKSYKEKIEKPIAVCKIIFGYGIMLALFIGGLTLIGYIVALCIGGEAAVQICDFIKNYVIKIITYLSTIMVLFGLIIMYVSGQTALSAKKNKGAEQKTIDSTQK